MSNGETQEATGWRPSEGDSVSGKVVDLDRAWSDYGNGFYPLVTLEDKNGKLTNVHCFHAVLRSRMVAVAPKLGDRLTITYKGKRTSKDGRREVSIYQVEAPDRQMDEASFWQGLGAENPARQAVKESDIPIDDDNMPLPF